MLLHQSLITLIDIGLACPLRGHTAAVTFLLWTLKL